MYIDTRVSLLLRLGSGELAELPYVPPLTLHRVSFRERAQFGGLVAKVGVGNEDANVSQMEECCVGTVATLTLTLTWEGDVAVVLLLRSSSSSTSWMIILR